MDLTVRAFRVVQAAISDTHENAVDAKNASARKGDSWAIPPVLGLSV